LVDHFGAETFSNLVLLCSEAPGKGNPKKHSPVQSSRSLNRGNHFHVYLELSGGSSFTKQHEKQSEYPNQPAKSGILTTFYSENCVLCHFGDSEFEHGFGGNPDLLLRLGIKARARFSLLLHQLAKAGQNEFAGLFGRFVSESTERIEEYSSGLLIGLGCFSKSELKVCFGHL